MMAAHVDKRQIETTRETHAQLLRVLIDAQQAHETLVAIHIDVLSLVVQRLAVHIEPFDDVDEGDAAFARLVDDVHRISDGLNDVGAVVNAIAAREPLPAVPDERTTRCWRALSAEAARRRVSPPATEYEGVVLRNLTAAAAKTNAEHPGWTWVASEDLAVLCKLTQRLLEA